jgi:simple sugar transport system permease protein
VADTGVAEPPAASPAPRDDRPAAAAARGHWFQFVFNALFRWREASIFVVGIGLVVYFGLENSAFVSTDNIRTISQYAAAPAIIAAGEVMLLICGEIDLSVGNIFTLAPIVMYAAYTERGVPLVPAVILGILVGAGAGVVNGLVTVLLKVPSFITTLGMSFLLNGIALTISNGFPQLTPGSGAFSYILGHADYSEIVWAIGIILAMQILLSFTPWGLHTIATGGNILGAEEVGVNVHAIKIGNFVLVGMLASLAGIMEAVRTTSVDPSAGGTPIMFAAVVAAVIGGTSLVGGSGTIVGAFIGALVIASLQDGLTLIGISAFTYNIILGAAIIVAMIVNIRLQLLRGLAQ